MDAALRARARSSLPLPPLKATRPLLIRELPVSIESRLTDVVFSYLTANTASTARYVKWFGTYTSARHSTVASHYSKMLDHPYADYEYDCTCTDSDVYAYVYPSQYVLQSCVAYNLVSMFVCLLPVRFGTIYLCGVFWSTTTTGTDSRVRTPLSSYCVIY